jgi:type I restriction enzyme R subunit
MSREQLISLLSSSANLMDERDDIADYIKSLEAGKALNEKEIRDGYQKYKDEKYTKELAVIANKQGLEINVLQDFVSSILSRMIFDGEQLTELLSPFDLSWKERREKELKLMEDLIPVLKSLTQGREISGLKAYE